MAKTYAEVAIMSRVTTITRHIGFLVALAHWPKVASFVNQQHCDT